MTARIRRTVTVFALTDIAIAAFISPYGVKDMRKKILSLVDDGLRLARSVDKADTCYGAEALGKRALAHLNAANTLLGAYPELHSELIEHPDFMELRKLARRFATA